MFDIFKLNPFLQVVFETKHEFTEQSFRELSPEQYTAYHRDFGHSDETIFQPLPFESTVSQRTDDKITWELPVVTNREKQLLIEAVRFIIHSSQEMPDVNPTFQQRLDYLRPRFPPIVSQKPET